MNREPSMARPYLITKSLIPENQESPLPFIRSTLTPEPLYYIRNHFPYPELQAAELHITVAGEVMRPALFRMNELRAMPSKEITVVMECAGNKRAFFEPKAYGEQWENGAISQGVWKGVPLRELVKNTGVKETAVEVLFEGRDEGHKAGLEGKHRYARSLPLTQALHPDTLIAYELDGASIPFKHGYPFRLIVPQWYAMASVKWMKSITLIPSPFKGPFQTNDYVYYPHEHTDRDASPVTRMNVNSSIVQPVDGMVLDPGVYTVSGLAWTGMGTVAEVEVSLNRGAAWEKAKLHKEPNAAYGWMLWTFPWNAERRGEYVIVSRARDTYGRVQPERPLWNRKGYGYNAVSSVKVRVESSVPPI